MRPDDQALRRDIASATFTLGRRRKKWKILGINFPFALFFIAAAPVSDGPTGFLLRSECSGYPAIAPTSQLWHGESDTALPLVNRPRKADGSAMIEFQDYQNSLYLPVDRNSADHFKGDQYEGQYWTQNHTITFLLEIVYDVLHAKDYCGANLPVTALNVPKTFMGNDIVSIA